MAEPDAGAAHSLTYQVLREGLEADPTYDVSVRADVPYHFYRLEDGPSYATLADYPGLPTGNPGTWHGSPTTEPPLQNSQGAGVFFDGSTYATMGAGIGATGNDDWSLEVWFNLAFLPTLPIESPAMVIAMWGSWDMNGHAAAIQVDGQGYVTANCYNFSSVGYFATSDARVAPGTTHQAVATYDGFHGTLKIYLDGVLQGIQYGLVLAVQAIEGRIGRTNEDADPRWTTGTIQAVSTWTRTLTARDVERHYELGLFEPGPAVAPTHLNLAGVVSEPAFVAHINGGYDAITLELDHYPSELQFFDIIEVGDGRERTNLGPAGGDPIGRWKYEEQNISTADGKYGIVLTPLVAELYEAGFTANYTNDHSQDSPPLGPAYAQDIVVSALRRTKHCSGGLGAPAFTPVEYAFNDAQPADALDQVVLALGPGWYWFCHGDGEVEIRQSQVGGQGGYNAVINSPEQIEQFEILDHVHDLVNEQPVSGGAPADGGSAIRAVAQDLSAGPYGIRRLGRRRAANYSDTSLVTQASANLVAANLLAMRERVVVRRRARVVNLTGRYVRTSFQGPYVEYYRVEPGQVIGLELAAGDASEHTEINIPNGGLLITRMERQGGTDTYDLELADLAYPMKSGGGGGIVTPAVALGSTFKNPFRLLNVLPYTFGLVLFSSAQPLRHRFELPQNLLAVGNAILSFNTQDNVSGISLMIDGIDRTTELGGPWGTGTAFDVMDLNVTQWLRQAGFHNLVFTATAGTGTLESSLLVSAALGAT